MSSTRQPTPRTPARTRRTATRPKAEGWHGWDDYAPFYDWENAQTVGRQDVPFWQAMARRARGPVLELGCGTGRISIPVGRTGARVVGVDRSAAMLDRARRRVRRAHLQPHVTLVRGDIRALPFADAGRFDLVMAPYGILQSLLEDRDLRQTLASVARVIAPGGTFGIELVADLPSWKEYRRRVRLAGWRSGRASHVSLIESVKQDRHKKRTIFEQEFVEARGATRHRHRFSLTFRTLGVRQMSGRLERAGFSISAVLGDYDGTPWDPRAETWIILATRAAAG